MVQVISPPESNLAVDIFLICSVLGFCITALWFAIERRYEIIFIAMISSLLFVAMFLSSKKASGGKEVW